MKVPISATMVTRMEMAMVADDDKLGHDEHSTEFELGPSEVIGLIGAVVSGPFGLPVVGAP